MKYEIVNLEEKIVVGFSDRTNNSSPDMGSVIGGLWQRFYSPSNYPKITGRVNEKALGIYTDYSADETGDYTVMAACETDNDAPQQGFEVRRIPAGRYAKFIVKGNMIAAVRDFWQELWKMEIDRSFICDFEEYQNADPNNAEIHIYISCA